MTYSSKHLKHLLGNHRYINKRTGKGGLSGFPQDPQKNTLFINTRHLVYKDINGRMSLLYELPKNIYETRVNALKYKKNIAVIISSPCKPLEVEMCIYHGRREENGRKYVELLKVEEDSEAGSYSGEDDGEESEDSEYEIDEESYDEGYEKMLKYIACQNKGIIMINNDGREETIYNPQWDEQKRIETSLCKTYDMGKILWVGSEASKKCIYHYDSGFCEEGDTILD